MTAIDGPNPPEPVRDEEYFEQGHSSPHNPPTEIERVTCPKCKGQGRLLPPSQGKSTLGEPETFECYRCKGKGTVVPEVFVARTSRDELNELAFSKPSQGKPAYVPPSSEDALADLARILGTNEDGERVLSDKATQIWDLLFPYIADENGPDYSEANMEVLCADVLPKVWDLVLGMEDE